VFRFTDSRIDEASGIGVGLASPGVVYVQNDSGDSARFFAVDASTGATLAVYSVPGAQNVDWEDLAVARDARGVPSVWLADIGDNDAVRQEVRIYRVDEPVVDRHRSGLELTTAEPSVWRLRYPDGPVDAEALAVAPDGASYVVTKSFLGESAVYAVPTTADPTRVQTLRRVAAIRFSTTDTPGGPSVIGQLTATGAAISADGRVLAVRTYTDAYLWPVSRGDIAAALHGSPLRLALPEQRQGEGVAVRGSTLLVDSEGVGSTVYAVPTPALPIRSGAPVSTAAANEPNAAGTDTTGTTAQRSTPAWTARWLRFGLGALLLAGAGLAVSLRRRSR
jgi:outer membrane protein assembly factor BamB